MSFTANPCPSCRRDTLILWRGNDLAVCDACAAMDEDIRQAPDMQLLFAPAQDGPTEWKQNPDIEFGDLRNFIEECLRRPVGSDLSKYWTSSEETLAVLIDLLNAMIVPIERDPEFITMSAAIEASSKQIESQNAPIRSLEDRWRSLKGNGPKSQKKAEVARRELIAAKAALDNEIRQHQRLAASLERYVDEYAGRIKVRSVERLRRDFELWKNGNLTVEFNVPVRRVPWRLLEPAGDSWHELLRHFELRQRFSPHTFDLRRLKQIHEFGPSEIYVGVDSFDGYVVFCFAKGETAVLESPESGNATYLMSIQEWPLLSHLSKTALMRNHADSIERVVHTDSWLRNLRWKFGSLGIC